MDKSKVDGTLYGVPMQYNLQYLYYNKDLFEEAGLDPEQPPTTMEELAEDAKKLTNPDKISMVLVFLQTMHPIVNIYGQWWRCSK